MGEHNSPYFRAGIADGERDTGLVSSHPGNPPIGPDPDKEWSIMYRRGYNQAFDPTPHFACALCELEARMATGRQESEQK
jgi:hypothetical protein